MKGELASSGMGAGSVLSVIRASQSARLLVNTTFCRYFGFYTFTLIIQGGWGVIANAVIYYAQR